MVAAFARFAAIPPAERARLAALARSRAAAAGTWLLRAGEICRWVGFVVRGLVRYVAYDDERERNLGFDMEGRLVTEPESFRSGLPAQTAIQALEATTLIVLTRVALDELYHSHGCWDRIGRCIGEETALRKRRKELDLGLRSPRMRYLRMVEQRPYLVGRVPQHHLASYLRMAPETLSRVRASIGS